MWDSFSWHIKLSAVHFFLVCGLLYAPGDEGSFERPSFPVTSVRKGGSRRCFRTVTERRDFRVRVTEVRGSSPRL